MTFPWDELNNLRSRIEATSTDGKLDKERVLDIIYDYLVYAYVMGVDNTNEGLSSSIKPNEVEMRKSINKKVAGKDYKERVSEYVETNDIEAILKVAETDAHRSMEEASLSTARKAGAKYKTWNTMEDDRVRDEHEPLDKIKVGVNERFYTWDGNSTDRPGNFGVPQLDIGCRCYLTFSF